MTGTKGYSLQFTSRATNARTSVTGFGLTSQRVGQIYNSALRTLEAHPDYPFKPLIEVEQLTQGGIDD